MRKSHRDQYKQHLQQVGRSRLRIQHAVDTNSCNPCVRPLNVIGVIDIICVDFLVLVHISIIISLSCLTNSPKVHKSLKIAN